MVMSSYKNVSPGKISAVTLQNKLKAAGGGVDKNGKPIRPDYISATDAKGNLQKPYSVTDKLQKIGDVKSIVPELDKRLAGVNQDTSGIDALKAEGLRTGPSAWLNNEMARNQAEEQYQLGDIGSAGAKAAADARSQLASRGGLSSGASERMASSSGKDIMAQQQNLRRNADLGRMSLSSQDELNRMQAISQLTPAQQAAAQFQLTKAGIPIQQLAAEQGMNRSGQVGNITTANNGVQFDATNALKSLGGNNDYNSTTYGQDMGAWAAGKTADAMAASAGQQNPGLLGSGGFLGTGLGTDKGIMGTGIGGNSAGGKASGAATGALIGSAIMPGIGTLAGAGIGYAASCFIKGEKFLLADGSLIAVEDITPDHELMDGGKTFAAAQFKGQKIYDYNHILVDGSHAVLENGRWTRVKDSPISVRRPDKDGEIVHVVWNQHHRMVHQNGTIFADYAETDNTESAILHHKNLEGLNLQ